MTATAPVARGVVARGFGGDGRPLRFLMIVVGGWTGARIALLLGDPMAERTVAARGGRPVGTGAVATFRPASPLIPVVRLIAHGGVAPRPTITPRVWLATPSDRVTLAIDTASMPIAGTVQAAALVPSPIEHALPTGDDAARPVAPALPARTRWSGSAWALVRGSGDAGGVATPQLGGGQVGARVAYRLDARGRLAAVARVAAALGTRQQEGAFGIEWQSTRLPVRIVAEQRVGISNLRGGPALGLIGGVSALPLGAGFHADGYVQAGVVARSQADAYVDGALVATRTIAARGRTRVELGLGAWGAAQRGAARLDVGPSAVLVLPVARQALRIGVQWRERVAGHARPGSGAVLSLGADF
ncbi:hypothetical protein SAMN05216382_2312 [Sphingomonas palmae]|uniref:Uncharacterized protein n=1 Tax=Sphingomonas palmae TaxID=1855283 RepID=A0A1H7RPH2_9SPHN|nr:hypothetical protein [Sphingomonas palmae]SEL62082.1 hypothetical protein SAMN05216382_2312 [Sphingomonas palmae]